jgi:molybdate transport system substrate-binding protein
MSAGEIFALCAGATRGVVTALAPAFLDETGVAIRATFGAVGALREALDAGARCDVIVLTAAMIGELAREGRVAPASVAPVGRVRTGVAVPAGVPFPAIADEAALRTTLLGASAIHVPDLARSTAGIHIAAVLRRLGIAEAVAPRVRESPNGATAMRTLADAGDARAVGCTQVTEILYTSGVALVGTLPAALELSTEYVAAVAQGSAGSDGALRLVAWLTGPRSAQLRAAGGFER